MNVLFLGNSFTFFNDLPGLLTQFAASKGKLLTHARHTPGGFSFQRHWEEGKAQEWIRRGGWDAVVLQGNSCEGLHAPEPMQEYGCRLAAEVDRVGARKVFYQTWRYRSVEPLRGKLKNTTMQGREEELFPNMQATINQAYARLTAAAKGEVAPVGTAFEEARRVNPSWEFFVADAFHPSPLGSYLAGLVLYGILFREKPADMPGSVTETKDGVTKVILDLPEVERKALETIARQVLQ